MTDPARRRTVSPVNRPRRDLAIDLGICAAIVAYGLWPMLDASVNDPRATTIGPLLIPALLVAVPLRRMYPLAAACVFAVGCVVTAVPTFHQFRLVMGNSPVAVAILFPLSTRAPRSRALAGLAAVIAGLVFVGATESVVPAVAGAVEDGRVRGTDEPRGLGCGPDRPVAGAHRCGADAAVGAASSGSGRRRPRSQSRSTASASRRTSISRYGRGWRR